MAGQYAQTKNINFKITSRSNLENQKTFDLSVNVPISPSLAYQLFEKKAHVDDIPNPDNIGTSLNYLKTDPYRSLESLKE